MTAVFSDTIGRSIVNQRSMGRCELGCGRPGTNVHHRMREGRPWNPANLLRVCGAGNAAGCHGWIETHPTHAQALGLIVPRGRDFEAAPVFVRPAQLPRGWWLPDDDGMWVFAERPPTTSPAAIGAAVLALGEYLEAAA